MRVTPVFVVLAALVVSSVSAEAAQSYPAELTSQFVSWCTSTQNQPQTVCSCAVSQATVQIPAVGMASFLNAPEGTGMAATSTGVGAAALQILTVCAAGSVSSGSAGKSLMNSLGGY